jgi:hypothetical protein
LLKTSGFAGIWGGKGQGKTFQCNLAFKKLGISPIVMSAGELESGNAGEPAKLIRQRYREVFRQTLPFDPSKCSVELAQKNVAHNEFD